MARLESEPALWTPTLALLSISEHPLPSRSYSCGDLLTKPRRTFKDLTILILFIPNFGNFSENPIKHFRSTQHTKIKTSPAIHFASYSGRTRRVQGKEQK